MDLLPDDIVVAIGLSVAELLDLRDLASLASTSQRCRRLLLLEPSNFGQIARVRIAIVEKRCHDCHTSTRNSYTGLRPLGPATTLPIPNLRTLPQLAFVERFYTEYCEEHDRICAIGGTTSWNEFVDRFLGRMYSSGGDFKFDPIEVVLEVHSCSPQPHNSTKAARAHDLLRSSCCARGFERHWKTRVGVFRETQPTARRLTARPWGRRVFEHRPEQQAEREMVLAERGVSQPLVYCYSRGEGIWIEMYLRLRTPEDSGGAAFLELPPRPESYATLVPPAWKDIEAAARER